MHESKTQQLSDLTKGSCGYWLQVVRKQTFKKPLKSSSGSSLAFYAESCDYATEICWHNIAFSSCLSYLKGYFFLSYKIYVLQYSEQTFILTIALLYTGQRVLQLLIKSHFLCVGNNASLIPVILMERTRWRFKQNLWFMPLFSWITV